MPNMLQVAAVQMDANPAPVAERLARAEGLVDAAADAGAQLVLLPELFATGYSYEPATLALAEPGDGPIVAWMAATAARRGVHLAGSLLLREGDDVFNALLLVAPDGQAWRYDKQYPWGWERATFRAGRGGSIAVTTLGRIGMLICWDVAHPRLWHSYAGQVDLMLIASCPPDATNPIYHLPSGATLTLDNLGPAFARLKGTGNLVFGAMIDQQAAWLGVPAVHTVGCGQLRLRIPNGQGTLAVMAAASPGLVPYLPEADALEMSCGLVEGCRIVDAAGQTAYQTLTALFPRNPCLMLAGPAIANEFARGLPTLVVLAGGSPATMLPIARLLDTPRFRVRFAQDPLGIELGGILKNVYAIGLGFFDGKQIASANFRAAYLTTALEEMARLGVALGAEQATFFYLAGLGDLLATSLSGQSHNRQLGEVPASGKTITEIEAESGLLPEGYQTLRTLLLLAEKVHVPVPLALGIWNVISGHASAEAFIHAFLRDFIDAAA